MPDIKKSTLLPLLLGRQNSTGYCVVVLLAWIMIADGNIDSNELDFLNKIAEPLGPKAVPTILATLNKEDFIDIQLACEVLQEVFTRDDQLHFLELAILMTVADGYINFSEMQIIVLLADNFRINIDQVHSSYKQITGRDFPTMADSSSKAWWDSVDKKRKESSTHEHNSSDYSNNFYSDRQNIARIKALAILGLDEDASLDQIKSAYRRMAQVHHPDKFHSLGKEAVKAAEESFSRIQSAYELLRA